MDSQGKDESKIRRRDETLARRVGEALDQLRPRGADACPDAEVVAAYAEQALDPGESARWEGHFAACTRCRNVLRVLAVSADTPLAEKEIARLGELIAATQTSGGPAARPANLPRSWFADWRMRWLAPALGVAMVLAVWFAMRPPWRAKQAGSPPPTLVAQAPANEAPVTPAPAEADRRTKVAPSQNQNKVETGPPAARAKESAAPLNVPAPPAKKGLQVGAAGDSLSSSVGGAATALDDKQKATRFPEARELQPQLQQRAAPALPAPPPEPSAVTGAPAAPAPQAKAGSSRDVAGTAQPETASNSAGNTPSQTEQTVTAQESVPAILGGAVGGTASQSTRPDAGSRQTFTIVIRPASRFASLRKAPASSTMWRAGMGGIIERSNDAGRTWVSQDSPSPEDWLAGWAISDMVCWVAGRHGAIARTVDGTRWELVPPPAQATGPDGSQPDWTGVTTRDAQSATISTSDGRKFATADAGKTWQPQP